MNIYISFSLSLIITICVCVNTCNRGPLLPGLFPARSSSLIVLSAWMSMFHYNICSIGWAKKMGEIFIEVSAVRRTCLQHTRVVAREVKRHNMAGLDLHSTWLIIFLSECISYRRMCSLLCTKYHCFTVG